jgi:hypothetical protein
MQGLTRRPIKGLNFIILNVLRNARCATRIHNKVSETFSDRKMQTGSRKLVFKYNLRFRNFTKCSHYFVHLVKYTVLIMHYSKCENRSHSHPHNYFFCKMFQSGPIAFHTVNLTNNQVNNICFINNYQK